MDGIFDTLKLMVENNSPLLKNVLNDLCYLIKNKHIKNLIPLIIRAKDGSKQLEMLLQSQSFRCFFFSKLKCLSLQKYKGSFEFFFEKYFQNSTGTPECDKVLAKIFCQSPFSVGFGSYIVLNYKKAKAIFENLEALIAKCQEMKDFDVYRLSLFTS